MPSQSSHAGNGGIYEKLRELRRVDRLGHVTIESSLFRARNILRLPVAGFELIRLLRQAHGCDRIPALALTAYTDAQHRDAALQAGYDAHLGKPVDPDALCAIVANLCPLDSSD